MAHNSDAHDAFNDMLLEILHCGSDAMYFYDDVLEILSDQRAQSSIPKTGCFDGMSAICMALSQLILNSEEAKKARSFVERMALEILVMNVNEEERLRDDDDVQMMLAP